MVREMSCPTCGKRAVYPMENGGRSERLVCWDCGRYVERCNVEICRPLKELRKPLKSAQAMAPLDAWVQIEPPKRKRVVKSR